MSLVKNAGPYGLIIDQATSKTTPVDADSIGLSDSADSGFLKKLTWANLKATLIATVQTWTGKQTFDGGAAIKGATSAVAAGYVGERIVYYYSQTLSADATNYSNLSIAAGVTSFALTTGLWSINLHVLEGLGTSNALKRVGISTDSTSGYSDLKLGENSVDAPGAGAYNVSAQVTVPVTVSGVSTNFYVKATVITSASRTWIVSVVATRIA